MNPLRLEEIVRCALLEDIGNGDISTELTPGTDRVVNAAFLAKQDGVLCGTEVAALCFRIYSGAVVDFSSADGDNLSAGQVFGSITDSAANILPVERVALNFLQRLSGIATFARKLSSLAVDRGIRVVETRKTTPGLRMLEKYAVRIGGGHNHRYDLDSAVMLKDNHFELAGGDYRALVASVKTRVSHTMKVIAEAGSPEMVAALVEAGADVVLLDNFTPDEVRHAVGAVNGRCLVEVSGGISADNLRDYLIDGVDVISIGALTHSYKALDISLNFLAGDA